MSNAGRKNKYNLIEENLTLIQEWLKDGLNEKQCAINIGLSYAAWNKYKKEHPEFRQFINNCRLAPVTEIENALFMSAKGFEKTVKRCMKLKDIEYENGKKVREIERLEYYDDTTYYPPNPTSAIFLLTNWAKNSYSRDAAALEIKKKELKLKEEQGNW